MRSKHANPVTVILVLALVAAIAWRVAGSRDDGDDSQDADIDLSTGDASTDEEGTTFERRDFEVGDCVFWQDEGSFTDQDVVPCEQPHLSEVVGRSDFAPDVRAYPAEDEWDRFYEERCRPLGDKYLDGKLDPFGRLAPAVFRPTEESWAEGDRMVWCTLEVNGPDPSRHELVSQPATQLDQAYLALAGACLTDDEQDAVDCAAPHAYEVVSVLDLSDRNQRPSDDALFDLCGQVPRGTTAPSGGRLSVTFLGFDPESWAAGTRRGMCAVGAFGPDDQAIDQTGQMLVRD